MRAFLLPEGRRDRRRIWDLQRPELGRAEAEAAPRQGEAAELPADHGGGGRAVEQAQQQRQVHRHGVGGGLAPSAFQKRFCKPLVSFLAACAQRAFAVQLKAIATPAIFRHFGEVLAIDSTLIALADALAVVFPGPRTNTCPAAAKVNAVYSVLSASVRQRAD